MSSSKSMKECQFFFEIFVIICGFFFRKEMLSWREMSCSWLWNTIESRFWICKVNLRKWPTNFAMRLHKCQWYWVHFISALKSILINGQSIKLVSVEHYKFYNFHNFMNSSKHHSLSQKLNSLRISF